MVMGAKGAAASTYVSYNLEEEDKRHQQETVIYHTHGFVDHLNFFGVCKQKVVLIVHHRLFELFVQLLVLVVICYCDCVSWLKIQFAVCAALA